MKVRRRKFLSFICAMVTLLSTICPNLGLLVSEVHAATASVQYHGSISYGGATVGNFTINGEQAYCMDHDQKGTPLTGTSVTSEIYDNENIAKCLYYGWGGQEQWSGFSSKAMGVVYTSLALYYFGYGKTNSYYVAKPFIEYIESKSLPTRTFSFSNANLVAYRDGNIQRTQEINLQGDSRYSISINLQNGVTLHNLTKGTTSQGSVTISGGDRFYLSSSLDSGISGAWTSNNITGTCYKYKSLIWVSGNSSLQKLAQKVESVIDPDYYINLSVKWLDTGGLTIQKTNANGDKVPGATFKIWNDSLGYSTTKTTNSEGKVILDGLVSGTYNIQETSAPTGYLLNNTVYTKTITAGQNASDNVLNVSNNEPTGTITITKTNTNGNKLQGATFKITATEKITNKAGTITYYEKGATVATVTTGSDGTVTKTGLPLGKYTVTETGVPSGYLLNTEPKNVTLSYKDQNTQVVSASTTIANREPTGNITVVKTNTNGDKVSGATFKITAAEKITNKAGTITYYEKGATVATVTTGNDGTVTKTGLPLGKYTVTETGVPSGYLLNTEPKNVTLSYKDQNTQVVSASTTIANREPTGNITVVKTNTNGDKVSGATFKITAAEKITNKAGTITHYEKGATVATVTTGSDGTVTKTGLPLGKYTVTETGVPSGYLLNTEPKNVTLSYKDQNTQVVSASTTIANREPTGNLTITKEDETTGNSIRFDGTYQHGDTSISGSVYTLYASQKITNKAGSITYFNPGDEVATFTFNEKGIATIKITNKVTKANLSISGTTLKGLPMGTYILRETSVPTGYTQDRTVYTYTFTYINSTTPEISKVGVVYNTINREPFEIIKISSNDHDTAELIEGAEFTAILKKYVEYYGSFEEASKHTSEYASDEWCVMTTDNKGYAKSSRLAYGTYIVNETYVPNNDLYKVDEFEVTVRNNSETATQNWKVENDTPFMSYIKMVKKDAVSGDNVTYSNATFELYKLNSNTNEWEQVNCKVGKNYYTTWTTDKDGYAYTETQLKYGTYKIVEVGTPTGYLKPESDIIFKVSMSNPTCEYDIDGDAWITIEVHNRKPTGTLRVNKTVNLRNEIDTSMINDIDFTKISFELVANEDIIDYTDGSIIYKKGQSVGTYNLDSNGALIVEDLPMGKYYLKEIATIEGAVLDETKYDVIFEQSDTTTKEYTVDLNIKNETTCIEISKTDITGEKELEGAKLTVVDENNEVMDTWVSTEKTHKIEGLLVDKTYILKEETAPEGYVKANEIKFKIENTAEIQKVTMIDKVVEMTKVDIKGNSVEGAELKVIDKDGNTVDSWTSTNEIHKINNLVEGETYTLYEDYAPEEFVISKEKTFIVTEDKETQHIEIIDKQVEISKVDVAKNKLAGATLVVTSTKTKNIVDKWVSTKEPHKVSNLIEGESYVLHEEISINGFVKAKDIEFTVTEDKETQHIEMIDKQIQVLKVNEEGKYLEGAILQVLDNAGDIVDEWETTSEVHYVTGLVEGNTYVLHEEYAPNGFAKAKDIEFTVTENKETQYIEMADKQVQVLKVNEEGKYLEGATLQVLDNAGDIVDEWVSDGTVHNVLGLTEGEIYTLVETEAPKNYKIANPIEFTVSTDKKTDVITMIDELDLVEVTITKIANKNSQNGLYHKGEALAGCTFTIYDENGNIVNTVTTEENGSINVELLRGIYTVVETEAPDWYLNDSEPQTIVIDKDTTSLSIEFKNNPINLELEIDKTGIIQAQPNDEIRYDFKTLINKSNVSLDNFTWEDNLPYEYITITKLFTGTYNEDLNYDVYYKLVDSDEWHLFGTYNTQKNNCIDFTKIKGIVSDFKLCFGTVMPDFSAVDTPFIYTLVNNTVTKDDEWTNYTSLTGDYTTKSGETVKLKDKADWTVTSYGYTLNVNNNGKPFTAVLPRTGDVEGLDLKTVLSIAITGIIFIVLLRKKYKKH